MTDSAFSNTSHASAYRWSRSRRVPAVKCRNVSSGARATLASASRRSSSASVVCPNASRQSLSRRRVSASSAGKSAARRRFGQGREDRSAVCRSLGVLPSWQINPHQCALCHELDRGADQRGGGNHSLQIEPQALGVGPFVFLDRPLRQHVEINIMKNRNQNDGDQSREPDERRDHRKRANRGNDAGTWRFTPS